MTINCPECKKKYNCRPEELIGKYFVCPECKSIFLWESLTQGDSMKKPKDDRLK
jgi:transposase-like protein